MNIVKGAGTEILLTLSRAEGEGGESANYDKQELHHLNVTVECPGGGGGINTLRCRPVPLLSIGVVI